MPPPRCVYVPRRGGPWRSAVPSPPTVPPKRLPDRFSRRAVPGPRRL